MAFNRDMPIGADHVAAAPHHGVFVGRDMEIAALRAGLVQVRSGHGRLFLLIGEPGIGKTRTAEEFADYVGREDAQVLCGRCHEGDGAPAYWPWIQVIRAHLRGCDAARLMSEMGPGAAAIAQVAPEVRECLGELPTLPTLQPEQARFRFFDSLTAFFKNAARLQPLVLVLDDLHWADKPSLLLLQFLAHEMHDAHLLVVATYRDLELQRDHPLFQTLGELARAQVTRRIELRGLGLPDIARYLETITGVAPPERLVDAVYRETEGNPFYMGEVVRLLMTETSSDGVTQSTTWRFGVPGGVREVIGRRLDGLSADCNHVLANASVIGREFGLAVLHRLTDLPESRLLQALGQALASRMIVDVPRAIGRYGFAHALIRETLYASVPLSERIELHRKIGEILEQMYGANPEPHVAELAYHFFEAANSGGDVGKAVDYSTRAAMRAERQLAYENAVHHYERALCAFELAEPADEQQRGERLLALGEAQRKAGDTAHARQTFRRAADLAQSRGEAEQLARAALGMGLGTEWIVPGVVDEALVGLLENALHALGEGDGGLRAALLARLAAELHYAGSRERSLSLSRDALQMAWRVGDRKILAYALNWTHFALWGPENLHGRLGIATEAIRLAEDIDDKELAFKAHTWRVIDILEVGDVPKVDAEIDAVTRLAELLKQPAYLWFPVLFHATRALLAGRLAESEKLARQASSLGRRAQIDWMEHAWLVQLFSLRREQGRLEEFVGIASDFVERNPTSPAGRCFLGLIHSELGSCLEARNEFERLAANNFSDLHRDAAWLFSVAFLAEICAFLGDAQRAGVLYELLLPYVGRSVVIGNALGCTGAVDRNLGLLAATRGHWDEATRHFESALAMNAQMGAPLFVARTRYEYARMLIARGNAGDQAKASGLLAEALATAQTLGMNSLSQKIVDLRSNSTAADVFRDGDEPAGTSASVVPPRRAATVETRLAVFRKEGDYWTIGYPGAVFRLRDSLGLRRLALLLGDPDREFLATDLLTVLRSAACPDGGLAVLRYERQVGRGTRFSIAGGLGDTLDRHAVRAYKNRLESLREQLTEATTNNDRERATRAQEEIDALTDELTKRVGLGGRGRKAAPHLERARVSVTRTLKAAVRKIAENDEQLGRYLGTTIKTGTFCSYTPEPYMSVSWKL